jgi:hypothetical protein
MGEVRLYAIGIDELRGVIGAPPEQVPTLRAICARAFTPTADQQPRSRLYRLGPLFRRHPEAPVISPTDPEPHDVDVLLSGGYVPHDRVGASWRILEALTQGLAWGSTRLTLTDQTLDELDFALARGGVSAAVGLRHLLSSSPSITLLPVEGLTVGWHPYDKVLDMLDAYRSAIQDLPSTEQQELVSALVNWLEAFPAWARVAGDLGRPRPDLVAFWAR